MKTYTHLFFDLDHTLWDFEKNSEETLVQLFEQHQFHRFELFDEQVFLRKYSEVNRELWQQYNSGAIDKATLRAVRFVRAFTELGLATEHIPPHIADEYLAICPTKPHLFPGTKELLSEINGKYRLAIITNGFSESQYIKLRSGGILSYFESVIISEEIGFHKPDIRIFHHALDALSATAANSVMVGDNLDTDIAGAANAGIDQVYFNPGRVKHSSGVTYEISHMADLRIIL